MIKVYMPVQIFTGKDCIEKNIPILEGMGKKALLVTGRSSGVKSGAQEAVVKALESFGAEYKVFNEVEENPAVETCQRAGQEGAAFKADFIIGIGGGSPMDAAKAVSVFAANPGLSENDFYKKKWNEEPLPVVLVGTTSGTGSEVTDVSVLTDCAGKKHSIHDPRLFARAAFGDPSFTCSVPRNTTLSTGLDILMHAIESCFSKRADSLSEVYSTAAVRKAYSPLLKAADQTLTYEDREMLYEASILAGLAINIGGTVFPHNMGYYLTEQFSVPHGAACAAFLPDLLDHMKKTDEARLNRFYRETGLTEEDMTLLLEKTLPEMHFGMSEEEIDRILPRWENNNSVNNTLGGVSPQEVREILTRRLGS